MASSLLARAAKEIQSKNKSLQRIREEKKDGIAQTMSYAATAAGSVGAAYVDSKWGDGESPPETLGVPRNALIGLAGVAYGLAAPKGAPGRNAIGHVGMGFLGAAIYRFSFDKLEEKEAEKAAKEAAAAAA